MSRAAGVMLLGGGGFIGRALARRLAHANRDVHILGRHNASQMADLLPLCDTVIHLASATTPTSSATQPSYELDNLALTLRLLDLMQNQPEMHLIYFSSGGAIYGNPSQLPVSENAAIAPLSNYGAGKAAQESFLQVFRASGHAVTILRPSNAYGPDQNMRGGFGLIRTLLEHAKNGSVMEIWGDGENVRDYIYIEDLVEACFRIIGLPSDSGTYNLGSGVGFSINQVRNLVENVAGEKLNVEYKAARNVDVSSVVLDISHLQDLIEWKPEVRLEEGIAHTWEWVRKR